MTKFSIDYKVTDIYTIDMANYTNYTYNPLSGVGSSPSVYTVAVGAGGTGSIGAIGASVGSSNWTAGLNGSDASHFSQSATINLSGRNADINVNGKSLCKAIEAIEQRLAILKPAPELECDWNELKRLGDEYRRVEADIREKMKVWEQLKKDYE